jgi:lysophospholipase L1-like esterase
LDSIVQFDGWLKEYVQRERIPVFDLGAQLQRSNSERWLRPEYDVGDKLHLNESGYRILDAAFAKFLTGWEKGS